MSATPSVWSGTIPLAVAALLVGTTPIPTGCRQAAEPGVPTTMPRHGIAVRAPLALLEAGYSTPTHPAWRALDREAGLTFVVRVEPLGCWPGDEAAQREWLSARAAIARGNDGTWERWEETPGRLDGRPSLTVSASDELIGTRLAQIEAVDGDRILRAQTVSAFGTHRDTLAAFVASVNLTTPPRERPAANAERCGPPPAPPPPKPTSSLRAHLEQMNDLVVVGDHIYFSSDEAIGRVGRRGAPKLEVFAAAQRGVLALTGDGEQLVWSIVGEGRWRKELLKDVPYGQILRAPVSGGHPREVHGGFGLLVRSLVLHGEHLYYADLRNFSSVGTIARVPLAGGEPEALAKGPRARVVAATDEGLYWSSFAGAPPGRAELRFIPVDGSPARLIAAVSPAKYSIECIVLVDDDLYFLHSDAVMVVSRGGGEPRVFARRTLDGDRCLTYEPSRGRLVWATRRAIEWVSRAAPERVEQVVSRYDSPEIVRVVTADEWVFGTFFDRILTLTLPPGWVGPAPTDPP